MPKAKLQPGSVTDWLARARSDLALASIPLPDNVLYNDLCFHAQQAAEKSVKAVLILFGVEFQKVHDIAELISLLPENVPPLPAPRGILSLTTYAVMARYPGDYEAITEEDYREALQAATAVYEWAERVISKP
jgi:HEPN domain-containing protein